MVVAPEDVKVERKNGFSNGRSGAGQIGRGQIYMLSNPEKVKEAKRDRERERKVFFVSATTRCVVELIVARGL